MSIRVSVPAELALEDTDKGLGDVLSVHMPPAWESNGRILVDVNGFGEKGYRSTRPIECSTRTQLGNTTKAAIRFVQRGGLNDPIIRVMYISTEWVKEYGDHYRRYLELKVVE